MKKSTKSILAAAASIAVFTAGSMSAIACNAISSTQYQNPWKVTKFQDVLSKSKLQGLDSSECITNAQLQAGYWASGHFREVTNNRLEFTLKGDSLSRVELRGDSWKGDSVNKSFKANVNIRGKYKDMAERFTFAQIHVDSHLTNNTPDYPPLRLTLIKEKEYEEHFKLGDHSGDGRVYEKYIWAAIRPFADPNAANGDTLFIPIAPAGIFDGYKNRNIIEITYNVENSKDIEVTVNGVTHKYPMDSWVNSGHYMYHKAGCYLQTDGNCKTDFYKLEY